MFADMANANGGNLPMDLSHRFWNASIEELSRGFAYDPGTKRYTCLVCGAEYETGIINPDGELLCAAEKAIERHITREHSSMFKYLLGMNKQYTGLTELQRELLICLSEGLSDKETAERLGIGSTSTVRNHRFKLREREKQAKVYLALMSALETAQSVDGELVEIHRGATMVDERYAITEDERRKLIERHFEEGGEGALRTWPTREKRKLVVLQHITKRFEAGRKYTEKEINEILKAAYHDNVTLRRYLIEYGFLDRARDGSAYWVNA
jgi:hypothetical protein